MSGETWLTITGAARWLALSVDRVEAIVARRELAAEVGPDGERRISERALATYEQAAEERRIRGIAEITRISNDLGLLD